MLDDASQFPALTSDTTAAAAAAEVQETAPAQPLEGVADDLFPSEVTNGQTTSSFSAVQYSLEVGHQIYFKYIFSFYLPFIREYMIINLLGCCNIDAHNNRSGIYVWLNFLFMFFFVS